MNFNVIKENFIQHHSSLFSVQTCVWNKKKFSDCEPSWEQEGFTGSKKRKYLRDFDLAFFSTLQECFEFILPALPHALGL